MSLLEQLTAALAPVNSPGGAAAIVRGGEIVETAHFGVTRLGGGVPVTAETIFHIGSITKLFNATLVMQLVDEGLVSLDDPVQKHLHDFTLPDADAAAAITVRMLLNHSSGIDGEMISQPEFDRDRIEDGYRAFCRAPVVFPPGAAISYCNAASVIAGHLVQTVRGRGWYELIRERIYTPLGMRHAIAHPSEALRYAMAPGHLTDPTTRMPVPAPRAYLPGAMAPAGATLTMTASDLARFAIAHMRDGAAADGGRLLSPASAQAMRTVTIRQKVGGLSAQFGLDWLLGEEGICRHAGAGIGTAAVLVCHPASQTAIALMSNVDAGGGALAALAERFFKAELGIDLKANYKPQPDAPGLQLELSRYVGTYTTHTLCFTVIAQGGALHLRLQARASLDAPGYLENALAPVPLMPLSLSDFRAALPEPAAAGPFAPLLAMPLGFAGSNGHGPFQRLLVGGRVLRRLDSAPHAEEGRTI